jgi:HK97 family phage major capsid protein
MNVADEMKSVFEQFKQKHTELETEVKKQGEATQETKNTLQKMNDSLDELKKFNERLDEVETKLNRPMIGEVEQKQITSLQRKAFEKFLRYGSGESSKTTWHPDELKALSTLSDADGGFLVPADFETDVLKVAQNMAEIRPYANVGTTNRDKVQVGKITQRAVIGWGTESVAVSPQDLAFGLKDMPINEMTALVLVPNSTLEDSGADLFGELSLLFGEDMAAEEDNQFIVGSGVNRPEGILSNTDVQARYVASGVAAALTDGTHNGVDVLIQAQYKLKKTYRANGTWAFNSSTEAVIRQLKDTTGQYLWQPPVQAGAPATLLGRPIINPEGAPDVAAGAFPIVFGDFRRGYRIRDRRGMTIQRLVERYAEYRQTGFLVTKRVGGQVVMSEAFVPVKIATS